MNLDRAFSLIEGEGHNPSRNALAIIAGTAAEVNQDPRLKYDPAIIVANSTSRVVAKLTGVSSDKIEQAERIGKSLTLEEENK